MRLISNFIKYCLYKRVLSCFILAISFCACVGLVISFLSIYGHGVSFDVLSGNHLYNVGNPITVVSLAGTFITASITLLGFALNSFAKRGTASSNGSNKKVIASPFEEAAGVLLVRYKGKAKSLLFLNVFCFPLLARAFVLLILLALMFAQCFFGEFRIFYLVIYFGLMCLIILSILISVFEIYSDVNFTLFKACSIIIDKIKKKVRFLNKTMSYNYGIVLSALRRYAQTDIFRGVVFLDESFGTILYLPLRTNRCLEISLSGESLFLTQLCLCSKLSNNVMFGKYFFEGPSNNNGFDAFDSFRKVIVSIIKTNDIIESFNSEIEYWKNDESLYGIINKESIINNLVDFRDKIYLERGGSDEK